ncbi:beta-L-arabinofuranosidase domain-containing protein [Planctomyces sp. SH-PL62]|uniref:glycoside hydrolase family 127 protein n=1 Tax=Planctomyces sp. SH-PL62 TaxID=1636152 RepID=UPI00078C9929|nr:beta-L-arabinofuranosidase domain-containing protein [Planctomyces sp. SH-PL62]AMV36420.1 Non-reducing end beta-L-arabinofuranosidase [Planctomyces sp. SH-PL62]
MKRTTLLLSLLVGLTAPSTASADRIEPLAYKTPDRLPDAARLLSPSRIKLGGWLGNRVALNEKVRLLNVDVEPLLAGYRKRPGSHPWIGEHVGKWLHAATLAWANTGDPALKAKLDKVVADLVACQEPDGYLGTYVPEKRFGLFPGADWDVWSHKYNLIGLLTYHQYTGDPAALDACRRMGDLLIATFPAKRSILEAGTHVGMAATSVLEPIVLLYRSTGDARYLDFARYLVKSWDEAGGPEILSRLTAGKGVDEVGNGKAYEMLSNLVGLCELARATGDRAYLDPVIHAWDDVVANRLYVTGSASAGEHFHEAHVLPNSVGAHIGEVCVTTTWIQLSLQLLRFTGERKYAEAIELAAYNHLAAAQHPAGDDWCYYTALEGRKQYDAHITCCHSSGPRGMALVVQAAYLTTEWEGRDAVIVETRETSEATFPVAGRDVVIDQSSEFPRSGTSTMTLRAFGPFALSIVIPKPAWSRTLRVSTKGSSSELKVLPDGSIVLSSNDWRDGTTIQVNVDLEPRAVPGGVSNPDCAALTWGPFVLAYDEARNPGGPPARAVGLTAFEKVEAVPGQDLAFRLPVVGRDPNAAPSPAVLVPFADAGSTGGAYRVWLRAPGVPLAVRDSILAYAEESRSREGNVGGSINDGDPETYVVTFDARKPKDGEDWYAVALTEPTPVRRVVFRHGRTFHDGGWFDATKGKPRVQIRRDAEGPWETIGELADYPAATATQAADLKPGQPFELKLKEPVAARGVRVVGVPASGDAPDQAFSSCAELEAFSE